jgi:hypothetical protein
MSAIVEKITEENEQREGAAVVGVTKGGTVFTHMRGGLPAHTGVADINTKWGARFAWAAAEE